MHLRSLIPKKKKKCQDLEPENAFDMHDLHLSLRTNHRQTNQESNPAVMTRLYNPGHLDRNLSCSSRVPENTRGRTAAAATTRASHRIASSRTPSSKKATPSDLHTAFRCVWFCSAKESPSSLVNSLKTPFFHFTCCRHRDSSRIRGIRFASGHSASETTPSLLPVPSGSP